MQIGKVQYKVLSIDGQTMSVRYEDGTEADLKIHIQERIWENIVAEQEPKSTRRPDACAQERLRRWRAPLCQSVKRSPRRGTRFSRLGRARGHGAGRTRAGRRFAKEIA